MIQRSGGCSIVPSSSVPVRAVRASRLGSDELAPELPLSDTLHAVHEPGLLEMSAQVCLQNCDAR